MRRVDIRKVEAGMVTAQPIVSEKGIVLFSKGSILSQPQIERLQKLGVGSIAVEGEDIRVADIDRDQARRDIEERFKKVVSDPLMLEIRNLVLKIQVGAD